MAKMHLLSTAALVVTASAALAAPVVRDLHSAKGPTSVQKQAIKEMPTDANLAQGAMFGAAVEVALTTPGAQSVQDPSGKFVVRVADVGGERVVSLLDVGTNQSRQWKLAADAKEPALGATISEIMAATGHAVGQKVIRAGTPSDHSGK